MRNRTKKVCSRTLSGFLAFITVFALMVSLSLVPVMAADPSSGDSKTTFEEWCWQYYTNPTFNAGTEDNPNYSTEDLRVLAMGAPKNSNEYFEIYVDAVTGEVAIKDKQTGDYLFTNPFDVSEIAVSTWFDEGNISAGNSTTMGGKKGEILSQVEISYNDLSTTDSSGKRNYNSFKDAALLKQIDIKRLSGGVRIEYSIGQEESRTLVPRVFSRSRYEWMIEQVTLNLGEKVNQMYTDEARTLNQFKAFYTVYNRANMTVTDPNGIAGVEEKYPAFKDMDIAVFNPDAKPRELREVETIIKTYCPEYTFEDLDKDHEDAQWVVEDKQPANFRMALEYYLTDTGVDVRFPANGLTFDESEYSLNQISILKYMGAGSHDYNGYTFIPDGSGTLIRFEDVTDMFDITGTVYGEDYAYQDVKNPNQEVYRMPVFGVVVSDQLQSENAPVYTYNPLYVTPETKYEGFPRDSKGELTENHGDFEVKVPIYDALGENIIRTDSYKVSKDAVNKEAIALIPVYDYEKNDDGTLKLDENGKYIPVLNEDGTEKVRGYASYTINKDTVQLKNLIPVYKATKDHSTGYFAIVTEGDALTTIVSQHGARGRDHFFNSVYCTFTPRPKDSYNLSEAISVGKNTTYTVVSDRKYTGSFKIKYIMLTDPEIIAEQKAANSTRKFFETSYVWLTLTVIIFPRISRR